MTSTTQSTPNRYHASKPSPLIKPTVQSTKCHQRRLQGQTKSPTKSSRSHTTLYSTTYTHLSRHQLTQPTSPQSSRQQQLSYYGSQPSRTTLNQTHTAPSLSKTLWGRSLRAPSLKS